MNKYNEDGAIDKKCQGILYDERQKLLARSEVLSFMQESVYKKPTVENILDFHTGLINFATDTFLNTAKETSWEVEHLRNLVAKQQAQIDELNSRFAIEMDNEAITPTDGKGNDIG